MDYFSIINTVLRVQVFENKINNFVIYPFGKQGLLVKEILNVRFNIQEKFIIDNDLAKINPSIKKLDDLQDLDCSQYTFLICSDNDVYYDEIRESIKKYVSTDNIVDIFPKYGVKVETQTGKYSYGPLCHHWLVKQVGAFSCFAKGADVVENHPVDYISIHPFLYYAENNDVHLEYKEYISQKWYFPGINPKGIAKKLHKITIGNDVWLGKNVIITNSANIGNGVIAAAGAIITKDVPDYAVVMGVPARIVRYRYNQEQIKALNKIAWWDWPDEKIREYYDDFFIDINSFIEKHGK